MLVAALIAGGEFGFFFTRRRMCGAMLLVKDVGGRLPVIRAALGLMIFMCRILSGKRDFSRIDKL